MIPPRNVELLHWYGQWLKRLICNKYAYSKQYYNSCTGCDGGALHAQTHFYKVSEWTTAYVYHMNWRVLRMDWVCLVDDQSNCWTWIVNKISLASLVYSKIKTYFCKGLVPMALRISCGRIAHTIRWYSLNISMFAIHAGIWR